MVPFHTFEPNVPPAAVGVYFLVEGDEIVYVGSSPDVPFRVVEHTRNKTFSRALYLAFGSIVEARRVEKDFIRYLKPRLNTETTAQRDPAPSVVQELEALIANVPDPWRTLFKPRHTPGSRLAKRIRVTKHAEARLHLTDEVIAGLEPHTLVEHTHAGPVTRRGSREVADTGCPGLRLKVCRNGKRTFIMRFCFKLERRTRKWTLGEYDPTGQYIAKEPTLGAVQSIQSARVLCMLIKQHLALQHDPRDHIPSVIVRKASTLGFPAAKRSTTLSFSREVLGKVRELQASRFVPDPLIVDRVLALATTMPRQGLQPIVSLKR